MEYQRKNGKVRHNKGQSKYLSFTCHDSSSISFESLDNIIQALSKMFSKTVHRNYLSKVDKSVICQKK